LAWMSSTTIRKLRRISDGGKDTGYFLLPPQNWLDTIEKKEGKKVLYFSLRTQSYALVLTPIFEEPNSEAPRNSSPENVMLMLKQGNLFGKLREVRKGKHVYRIVNVPRVWVRAKEKEVNRKVIALSLTTDPESILVEPVFSGKPTPH
jgi:hypothetical protein